MVKVIDELESFGLAERRIDPDDRRKRAVHLTARGRKTLARARVAAQATADDVFGPLDAKELREHRMVVDDIVRRIAPFANVEVEPLGILELPSIAHLATQIRFEEIGVERMSFAEIVRRLHPTAALGVSPRSEAGERWLRDADRGIKRRTLSPNTRRSSLRGRRIRRWTCGPRMPRADSKAATPATSTREVHL